MKINTDDNTFFAFGNGTFSYLKMRHFLYLKVTHFRIEWTHFRIWSRLNFCIWKRRTLFVFGNGTFSYLKKRHFLYLKVTHFRIWNKCMFVFEADLSFVFENGVRFSYLEMAHSRIWKRDTFCIWKWHVFVFEMTVCSYLKQT